MQPNQPVNQNDDLRSPFSYLKVIKILLIVGVVFFMSGIVYFIIHIPHISISLPSFEFLNDIPNWVWVVVLIIITCGILGLFFRKKSSGSITPPDPDPVVPVAATPAAPAAPKKQLAIPWKLIGVAVVIVVLFCLWQTYPGWWNKIESLFARSHAPQCCEVKIPSYPILHEGENTVQSGHTYCYNRECGKLYFFNTTVGEVKLIFVKDTNPSLQYVGLARPHTAKFISGTDPGENGYYRITPDRPCTLVIKGENNP
jgi:hypothetical protein